MLDLVKLPPPLQRRVGRQQTARVLTLVRSVEPCLANPSPLLRIESCTQEGGAGCIKAFIEDPKQVFFKPRRGGGDLGGP